MRQLTFEELEIGSVVAIRMEDSVTKEFKGWHIGEVELLDNSEPDKFVIGAKYDGGSLSVPFKRGESVNEYFRPVRFDSDWALKLGFKMDGLREWRLKKIEPFYLYWTETLAWYLRVPGRSLREFHCVHDVQRFINAVNK